MVGLAALAGGLLLLALTTSLAGNIPSDWGGGGPWRRPTVNRDNGPPTAVARAARRIHSSAAPTSWTTLLEQLNEMGTAATFPEPFETAVKFRRGWRFWIRTKKDHSPSEFDQSYLTNRLAELERLTELEHLTTLDTK